MIEACWKIASILTAALRLGLILLLTAKVEAIKESDLDP